MPGTRERGRIENAMEEIYTHCEDCGRETVGIVCLVCFAVLCKKCYAEYDKHECDYGRVSAGIDLYAREQRLWTDN